MDKQIEELAWDISNCAEVRAAEGSVTHPCNKVVEWQIETWQSLGLPETRDQILTRRLQRPEAWTGDLKNAKILFLASNPSFDAAERFPTWDESSREWSKGAVVDFATRRFAGSEERGSGATDGPSLDQADRTVLLSGLLSRSVKHWRWVRNLSAFILGKDPQKISAHSDYVMTEIVHCKSAYEAGVPQAISKCSELWLDRMWALSGAELVIIAGVQTAKEFVQLYGDQVPESWGCWKDEKSKKGKGTWPKSIKELHALQRAGLWGALEQGVHTVEMELGGKPRLVIFFARPGGTFPTAPWKHEGLITETILRKWQERLNSNNQ